MLILNVSFVVKVKLSVLVCLWCVEWLKEMGLICGIVVLFDLKLFGVGMLVVIGFVFDCLMLEMFVVFEKVV